MKRPAVQELEELHRIALREHRPQGRSTRLIKEALERERLDARQQQPCEPKKSTNVTERDRSGRG